jgi:adenylylsulfate kinase
LWFTGLSGAGKSTLAAALQHAMESRGGNVYVLDGDVLRRGLCSDLGFSRADRAENIRRAGEVASIVLDAGVTVLAAFITPYRVDRDRLRSQFPAGRFIEVFVNSPLAVCEARDVKGLYAKARRGEIAEFTGVSAPFEPPLRPDIELRTDITPVEDCVADVLRYLDRRF